MKPLSHASGDAGQLTETQGRVSLQVVQHLQPGGIETMALALAGQGNSYIVSLQGNYQQAIQRWPRLQAYRERLIFLDKPPGMQPSLVMALVRLIKRLNVELVHSHHIGPLLYAGLAARLAGVCHRIHTEHDAWHLADRRRRLLERALLALVRPVLVADADIVLRSMRQQGINYPAVVIPNGIDTACFCSGDKLAALRALAGHQWFIDHQNRQQAQGKTPLLLGCAGRLVEEKGYPHLLMAMTCLPPQVLLLIAGDGPERAALERQIVRLGLSERVRLLGAVNDMTRFYQALDVFVMASLNEGLPLSPLEAQACDVPVVLTDVGGCREAMCPDTGVLVQPGDSKSLAWGIRKQMRNLQLSARSAGRISPRTFVVRQRNLDQMAGAYQQVIR